ncbi:TetR/AcrR family transcriptional regulator [Gordonia sp. X0973]|uniref:TetR/AcrR family transcriptional regulator n=1 Tax=Gordonia sp. X0973 TaxID=2742602 RepID=UPI000F5461B0|nr:TetR/AcrR family transcriptional regulator [Gordonia sp. X0973]QKT08658.1 TetR/AcrR family transcriptional regulator [Gordonia sp. X0973]
MTREPRRRLSADERREQLLDVAHAIVDGEGFAAATVGRIAADAGVDRSLVYQQFGDRAGLLDALIAREQSRAASHFDEAVAAPRPSGATRLTATFDGVLRAVEAHPATWRLFLFPPQGAPVELYARLAASQQSVTDYLVERLVALDPAPDDPELTAQMIQAAGRELLQLHLRDPQTYPAQRVRDQLQRMAQQWFDRLGTLTQYP